MGGDLLRTGKAGAAYGLGGEMVVPDYHSYTARGMDAALVNGYNGLQGADAADEYLGNVMAQHAMNSMLAVGGYGLSRFIGSNASSATSSSQARSLAGSLEGASELQARAYELNNFRDAWMSKNGTTAVIRGQNRTTGDVRLFIATEADTMPMQLNGRLRPNEQFIEGIGHAEETIINNVGKNWILFEGGAFRNVCFSCEPLIGRSMMRLGGPTNLRSHKDKTLFNRFWMD